MLVMGRGRLKAGVLDVFIFDDLDEPFALVIEFFHFCSQLYNHLIKVFYDLVLKSDLCLKFSESLFHDTYLPPPLLIINPWRVVWKMNRDFKGQFFDIRHIL